MKKCIYTLKDETQANFNSKEHIFPRSIGGINTLPKDWISDEFNSMMSPLERNFSRENLLIMLPRIFDGPNGRKNHSGKLGVSFMKKLDTNNLELGYIEKGQPMVIPQVKFSYPIAMDKPLQIHIICHDYSDKTLLTDALKSSDENLKFETITTSDEAITGKLIIGFINKRFYIGTHSRTSEEEMRNQLKLFFKIFKAKSLKSTDTAPIKSSSHVEYQLHSSFNKTTYLQVSAKIAFNCLAHITNQDFVLKNEFDDLRKAIVTGTFIDQYLHPIDLAQNCLTQALNFSYEHFVISTLCETGLIGVIGFFGGKTLLGIQFSDVRVQGFSQIPQGFICDWKQKKEYTLLEKIMR